MREELAGTAGADLDLVEHEEDALLIAQVTQALQEFWEAGRTPPSPWTGSVRMAQTYSSMMSLTDWRLLNSA